MQSPGDLLESAAFLQSVLEAVPAFVVLLDDNDCIRYINRVQPGFDRAQVIGLSSHDFIAPEYREQHRKALTAARTQGGQHSFLTQGNGADGKIAFYESRAIGVDDASGKRSVYIVALEVTEHVLRAETLRASEEQLRLAVQATGIGLWSWDLPTNTVVWSPRMLEITGAQKPMDGWEYLERCVHPDDREMFNEAVQGFSTGVTHYPMHRIVRPDGEIRWVAPSGDVTRNEQGALVRFLGGTLDVTSQRQLDDQLRQMQKLEAIGSLTAGVAHNFNNMIAVILPAIETALQQPSTSLIPASRRILEEAAGAARRAADLVAQLMLFAGQHRPVTRKLVDVGSLLEQVVSICRQTFDKQIAVSLKRTSPLPLVMGDAAALEQVFLNLIINARDASSDAQTPTIDVEVHLREHPDVATSNVTGASSPQLQILIRDNGKGMNETVRSRLFEPFFTTKPQGRGTGLGLATSRATLLDHGGSISISSTEGIGTCCEVTLPCSALTPRVKSEVPVAPQVVASRVLVVDDESAIREVIRYILERQGHEVAEAENAAAAVLQIDRGFKADLVLLDRSMPGCSPRQSVADLRDRLGNVPILFFTGQSVEPDEAALVQEVLLKPLSVAAIDAAVARWLVRKD